jgi:hypothetical protein
LCLRFVVYNFILSDVAAAKESKRAINAEIERLNEDLFMEAGKLVTQEVLEQKELKARDAVIRGEFESLMSLMMLQKERVSVLGSMIKEQSLSSGMFSTDLEMQPSEQEDELEWRKKSF